MLQSPKKIVTEIVIMSAKILVTYIYIYMRTSTLETNQHYHAQEETNNSKEIKNELASSVTKGKYGTKYKVVLKC